MQPIVRILVFLILAGVPVSSHGNALTAGDPMPGFSVMSGGKSFSESFFTARVLIITYETKETTAVNQAFKDRVLEKYPPARQTGLLSLAVINCSKYFLPIRNICISRVDQASDKLPITVYTDIDGGMFSDFFIKDNESNIFIADKERVIRYVKTGKMTGEEIDAALKLIEALLQEE